MSQRLPHETIVEQCLADSAGPIFEEMSHAVVSDNLKAQVASEEVEPLDLEIVSAGGKCGVVQESRLCQQSILTIDVVSFSNAE